MLARSTVSQMFSYASSIHYTAVDLGQFMEYNTEKNTLCVKVNATLKIHYNFS